MTHTIKKIGFAAFFSAAAALASQAHADSIQVDIDGVKNDKGNINIYVYKSEKVFNSYDYTKAFKKVVVKAAKGAVSAKIDGLEPGTYGLSMFHDENANKNYDMKGNMPEEGYAFSNNAGAANFPVFKDVKFEVKGTAAQKLKLIYLK